MAVVIAWDKLRPLLVWVIMAPIRLVSAVARAIACEEPLSWQIAGVVNGLFVVLGYRLHHDDPQQHPRLFFAFHVSATTWFWDTRAGWDSYQRHLNLWRQYGGERRGYAATTQAG